VKRVLACLLLFCACTRREPPPVILISIDTLRADHVSAERTPQLDALARDGIVFRNAWSHCPLTLPSHVSILTGLREQLGEEYERNGAEESAGANV